MLYSLYVSHFLMKMSPFCFREPSGEWCLAWYLVWFVLASNSPIQYRHVAQVMSFYYSCYDHFHSRFYGVLQSLKCVTYQTQTLRLNRSRQAVIYILMGNEFKGEAYLHHPYVTRETAVFTTDKTHDRGCLWRGPRLQPIGVARTFRLGGQTFFGQSSCQIFCFFFGRNLEW